MKPLRSSLLLFVAALCVALALNAFARMTVAAEGLWQTDFKAAQAKAKEDKKYMLVDFTGSDWCGWCIKLRGEVFDKEPFKATAPKQYVLVELDYPRQKQQSDELKKQNKELSEKYKIEGFPTILLMDADGQVIARTGYREGGPEEYLKHLADFSRVYENLLALKAKLDKVKGLDRAKLLDEIVDGYKKLGNESSDDVTQWSKEIIALDADNKAGLKVKYEFPLTVAEANKLAQTGKAEEARKLLDKALSLKGIPAEMRQEGYMAKVQISFSERKFVEVVSTLKEAKDAAPESPMAKRIDALIAQFSKVAEAQEAANKLEAGLANSKGLDRAKLLDKLIDAKQQLTSFDPLAGASIAKWSKEIVELDPDNKAGLKQKYQFKSVLNEATTLMRTGKPDEASKTLDKALETEGISAEDTQQAQLLKAQIFLMQQKNDEAVALMKKALEAAPQSKVAPRIQSMLRQLDLPKKPAAKKPVDD
jgi:thioredoxin-related protein